MDALRGTLRAVDAVNAAAAVAAALAAAALAVMLIAEVFLTSFASWSQPWAVEYAIYFQAFVLFLGSGWALRTGGHIRVAILLQLAPPRVARLADLLGTTFALGVVGFAAFALVDQARRTFAFGSTSFYPMGTPLWIPQSVLALGVTLLALAFAARLVRLVIGDPVEVVSAHGSGSGSE